MAPPPKSYKSTMCAFLSFKYPGEEFDKNAEIPQECLTNILPSDIVRFFNKKAYGKEVPLDGDSPTVCRSGTLLNYKKHLSCFMPRKNVQWDIIRAEGNPTKSLAVNEVIKEVKLHEVRKQGVASQARRPLEYDEFLSILHLIRTGKSVCYEKHLLGSILTTQWSTIGRIDDMMKLKLDDLKHNPQFPFSVKIQIYWSKNIREERDSPAQIILGSGDERVCALLNLALYLEVMAERDPTSLAEFLFGTTMTYSAIRDRLTEVFNSEEFKPMVCGKLGTHSFRKGAATYCSRCGKRKDHINLRGRWHSSAQQVDTYIDVECPYPDALIAACLTGPSGISPNYFTPLKFIL
jgi:hypothetical protein